MITIGVTGGVGSGKSAILSYLDEKYNCRILMSDNAAKDLEQPGGVLYEPLVKLLSESDPSDGQRGELLLPGGEINKQEMAARIFGDPELLKKINELVHPAVNQYILGEIDRERNAAEHEFFVLESALLIENGYDKILDSMWYIYCEESVRSERLRLSEDVFRSHCDTVIDNTGEFMAEQGAARQVDAAISRLREKM